VGWAERAFAAKAQAPANGLYFIGAPAIIMQLGINFINPIITLGGMGGKLLIMIGTLV
jgi:hypothetical protein